MNKTFQLGLAALALTIIPFSAYAKDVEVKWQDLDAGVRNSILAQWKQISEEKRGSWIEFRDKYVADMSDEQLKPYKDKAESRLKREEEQEKKIEKMREEQEAKMKADQGKRQEEMEKQAKEDAKKNEAEAEKMAKEDAKKAKEDAEKRAEEAENAAEKAKDETKESVTTPVDAEPSAIPAPASEQVPAESKTQKVKGFFKKFF